MITMERLLGQRVRCLGYAKGERTGVRVAGLTGTIVDRLVDGAGLVFVCFYGPDTRPVFFDWVDERDLVDG